MKIIFTTFSFFAFLFASAQNIIISKAKLQDKIKGGWAGQTIGVTYGGPYEFKFLGTMIQDYQPIQWNKGQFKFYFDKEPGLYDDIYLDLTFVDVIEKYGVEKFASAISAKGGSGVIHPDITIEESGKWLAAADSARVNPIYVVAPSTKDERLAQVTDKCEGFIYAASIMGVTGARSAVSGGAQSLVARIRSVSDKPVAVGLGVSTREQAREVAAYADGVIVGSAFVKAILDAPSFEEGLSAVTALARELSEGVRGR